MKDHIQYELFLSPVNFKISPIKFPDTAAECAYKCRACNNSLTNWQGGPVSV